jgi:thymidylate synthase
MLRKVFSHEMPYLKLIKDVIDNGVKQEGRNGTTYTKIGGMMRFSLENNKIPLITSKKLAWRVCLKELLWFINGETDNNILNKQNVHIWDGNSTREYLDSRGLFDNAEGDLGPVYGYQWRKWNKDLVKETGGIDQLQQIIDCLKDSKERNSRRLIMSAWNPEQLNDMALPPCHVLSQFHVVDNKLSCTLYQRSGDMGLGVPFNIASYCFLTHLLAKHCDLEAYEFVHFLGNMHIYDDHLEFLKEQIKKPVFDFPELVIKNKYNSIDDYSFNDFQINNYKFNNSIKMDMRV